MQVPGAFLQLDVGTVQRMLVKSPTAVPHRWVPQLLSSEGVLP